MAKSPRGGFSLVGEKELLKRMNALGKQSTQNRMARPALREASGEIRKAAKRLAPVRFGLLKKSIKNKVVTSKKTGTVFGVVGPAYGFKTVVGGKAQDPAKYGHLVEFGTVHSGPKPFLRPAYDSVNSREIIANRLRKELDKEAAKRR